MRKHGIASLSYGQINMTMDPSFEANKAYFKLTKGTKDLKQGVGAGTIGESYELPVVRTEDLTGPFPSY